MPPDKQDSFESHGSPLGVDEVRLAKQNLGWPTEPPFYIPEKAGEHFRKAIERGKSSETEWNNRLSAYGRAFPIWRKRFCKPCKTNCRMGGIGIFWLSLRMKRAWRLALPLGR